MSAINVFAFPTIYDFPQACSECACGRPETHVPVMRAPVVSARWAMETTSDGTRRLVERWSANRHE